MGIGNIIKKMIYNPYRAAKRYENVEIDTSAILLWKCTFRFDGVKKMNALQIGRDTIIGCQFIFESDHGSISIGERTFINAGTMLIARTEILIGSNVTIGWDCTIYDHNSHSLDHQKRQDDMIRQLEDIRIGRNLTYSKNWGSVKSRKIVIEDNAWIGFGCMILRGVIVGEGAVVGAGSVVRTNVEPWTVVAGNPAVLIRRLRD